MITSMNPGIYRGLPLTSFVTLLLAVSFSRATLADVEYSSFGEPGDIFQHAYNTVYGGASANVSLADVFTASFTGTLTSVELAIKKAWDLSTVRISLMRCDATTNVPLPATRAFLAYVQPPDAATIVSLNVSQQRVNLVAGERYALELSAATGAPYTIVDWALAIDPSGHLSFSSPDGGNTYPPAPSYSSGHAFMINAAPSVPEPAAALLVLLGIPACLIGRRQFGRSI